MKLIKKLTIDERKYLQVVGLKIPYSIEGAGERRIAKIGPVSIVYYREPSTEAMYLKLFGKKIYVEENRRLKHYKMRDRLDVATKQKIIEKEISPIMGYKLNLDNPRSYNEKINWLKLHNEDPRITICCDKYAVKAHIDSILGPGYTVPTIAQWNDPDNIDFNSLPDKFVLKVNWSSGFNIIVKDKATADEKDIKEKLKRWMQPYSNSYYSYFNWGYKNMKPVCYAEEYIEQLDGQLYDYKFLYSNGKLIYLLIVTDRLSDNTIAKTYFDENYNIIPIQSGHRANSNPELPKNLNKMLEVSKILADDFPLCRVDFYEMGDEIKIGEMTFYCAGGKLPITPVEWDYKLGDKIDLSTAVGSKS